LKVEQLEAKPRGRMLELNEKSMVCHCLYLLQIASLPSGVNF